MKWWIPTALLVLALWLAATGSRPRDPQQVLLALMRNPRVPFDTRIEYLPQPVWDDVICTALNVYMESRGEPERGQVAVAWVTRTRSAERRLKACDVVFEWLGAAQFSWTVYPISRMIPRDVAAWMRAQDIAYRVLVGDEPDPTRKANHFFDPRVVQPPWAGMAAPGSRQRIGGHEFLRIERRKWR